MSVVLSKTRQYIGEKSLKIASYKKRGERKALGSTYISKPIGYGLKHTDHVILTPASATMQRESLAAATPD